MLSRGKENNLPMIVRMVFDGESRRWGVLIPASHYQKTSRTQIDLENVDAMWAGPIEVPRVLADVA